MVCAYEVLALALIDHQMKFLNSLLNSFVCLLASRHTSSIIDVAVISDSRSRLSYVVLTVLVVMSDFLNALILYTALIVVCSSTLVVELIANLDSVEVLVFGSAAIQSFAFSKNTLHW